MRSFKVSGNFNLPFVLFFHMLINQSYSIVVGEKVVTPAAIVSFTVKLRLKPPGSEPIPSKPLINGEITVNGSGGDTVDVECEESSIDELIGRRSAAEEGVVPTPLAHAPHFPKVRYFPFLFCLSGSEY